MTPTVLAPPALLYDISGQPWVFSGMTDSGPAYLPQQAPMPMIAATPQHAPEEWANVTGSTVTYTYGERE